MPEGDELDLDAIDPDEFDNPQLIRQLRSAAQRNRKEREDGQAAIRKLTMLDAGVDVNSPIGRMFVDSYKGDLKDTAAIAMAWNEVAPPPPPPPAEEPPPPAGEQGTESPSPTPGSPEGSAPQAPDTGSEARRALAGEGSVPGGAPPANFREELLDQATHMMRTRTWEHAAGEFIHNLAQGVADGNVQALDRNGARLDRP